MHNHMYVFVFQLFVHACLLQTLYIPLICMKREKTLHFQYNLCIYSPPLRNQSFISEFINPGTPSPLFFSLYLSSSAQTFCVGQTERVVGIWNITRTELKGCTGRIWQGYEYETANESPPHGMYSMILDRLMVSICDSHDNMRKRWHMVILTSRKTISRKLVQHEVGI